MKTKTTYTPGPWQLGGWGDIYGAGIMPMASAGPLPTAQLVCKITWGRELHATGKEQAQANARLIAAAPDLLEALKMLAQDYNLENGQCDPGSAAGIVRAAIARAESR